MTRIIVANKFYYPRGGDCVYTIDLVRLLEAHGHEVAVFAMQHPDTLSTPWSKYFPSEVQFTKSIKAFDALWRPFGAKEVVRKFNALLDDFNPDILHLNNIHSQLSPVLAEIAYNRGIKVFWTLHDYKLICPRYDCLRERAVCELCLENKFNVIKYKCLKRSFIVSCIAYFEAKKWNQVKLSKYTDCFISPSKFVFNKMKLGGFPVSKITSLCHFVNKEKYEQIDFRKEDYICYVGRLSPEKGIETLIDAVSSFSYKLKIIGDGLLKTNLMAKDCKNASVEFLGFKSWKEIKQIVNKARFIVVPSEWYEVFGLVSIESLCLGTPVLGARIGGIPELIEEGVNGMTFESRNVDDLADKIKMMFDASFDYQVIAENARKRFDAENYYQRLMEIYGI